MSTGLWLVRLSSGARRGTAGRQDGKSERILSRFDVKTFTLKHETFNVTSVLYCM